MTDPEELRGPEPEPILRVLSSIRTHRVQSLLMGGQACVLYGAADFSRDDRQAPHLNRQAPHLNRRQRR
jgi:hypothetical protein